MAYGSTFDIVNKYYFDAAKETVKSTPVQIVETVSTIIVFGLAFSVWILNLHLDDFVSLMLNFLCILAIVACIFLFSGALRNWL